MNQSVISLVSILLLCGCATQKLFVEYRNYDVGRNVNVAPLESSKISSHNEFQDQYLFEWKGGCKFIYYVNKETKVVESWEYVSSPDKCTMGYNWGVS